MAVQNYYTQLQSSQVRSIKFTYSQRPLKMVSVGGGETESTVQTPPTDSENARC